MLIDPKILRLMAKKCILFNKFKGLESRIYFFPNFDKNLQNHLG